MRVGAALGLLAILLSVALPVSGQSGPASAEPSAGGQAFTPAARALGSRTYTDGAGDVVTVHRNLLGGQTYRDSQGGLVITRPTIGGGEVMRDAQGRLSTVRPNAAGGHTIVDDRGRSTVCRPTIGGQVFCQDQADAPALANPRAIRDAKP